MNDPNRDNPFAAPLAEDSSQWTAAEVGARGDVWTEDGVLLMAVDGAEFPDRCVKCNQPTHGRLAKKTYTWHPGWVYFLLLFNILIYIIGAFATRKTAELAIGLCEHHRRKRRNFILAAWGITLSAILTFVLAAAEQIPDSAFIASVVLLVVGIIVGIVGGRPLTAKRIERKTAILRGAGPEFLLSLSE